MATTIFTPSMLRGAGTRGVPEIPVTSAGFTNTYSMAFDGIDDRINVGSGSSISPTDEITLSCWINAQSLAFYDPFFYYGWPGTSPKGGYWLSGGVWSNGWLYLKFGFGDGVDRHEQGSHQVSGASLNTWYHIVATYDGADANMYVDANRVNGFSWGGGSGSISYRAGDTLDIAGNQTDGNFFFPGFLDEAAVWDVALDVDTITSIYNQGTPNDLTLAASYTSGSGVDKSGNLGGWWRMGDKISGATIPDQSGNGNDGTNTGSPPLAVITGSIPS
jgi:hypothetical protein